ncbi:MAG TPA: hypothetical protein VEF03_08060 [Candidatus Binataceae bacterium]|nr:hypothetical protein [Candidatus Binataceae bacterium]
MKKTSALIVRFAVSVAIALTLSATGYCAEVSGTFVSFDGKPVSDTQLHFEAIPGGDIFMTRTGADGKFSTVLRRGTYEIRTERGLVLKSRVKVDTSDVNVGQLRDGAPLDVRRPFQREVLGPAMVETSAPATAHLGNAAAPAGSAVTTLKPPAPAASPSTALK